MSLSDWWCWPWHEHDVGCYGFRAIVIQRRWIRSFWYWNKAGCLPQHWNLLHAQAEVEQLLESHTAGLHRLSGFWGWHHLDQSPCPGSVSTVTWLEKHGGASFTFCQSPGCTIIREEVFMRGNTVFKISGRLKSSVCFTPLMELHWMRGVVGASTLNVMSIGPWT